MKKILAILLIIIPFAVFAQTTKSSTSRKGMTFCGVPFGISVDEFKNRACTQELRDSLAKMVGAEECVIYNPNLNVGLVKGVNIAYGVSLSFSDK